MNVCVLALQMELCLRHRYSVLVQELTQTTAYPEYQATVLAFINYLLSSLDDLQQRMRLRSELNGTYIHTCRCGTNLCIFILCHTLY